MKNSRTFALSTAAAIALAGASARAGQTPPPPVTPSPTVSTQPTVTVNGTPSTTVQLPKPKIVKYKGRVLAFNMAGIIVQSMENQRMVWNFQYSTDLHNKVADMLGTGGFQPGDMITVYCKSGSTVAVKVKGKHATLR